MATNHFNKSTVREHTSSQCKIHFSSKNLIFFDKCTEPEDRMLDWMFLQNKFIMDNSLDKNADTHNFKFCILTLYILVSKTLERSIALCCFVFELFWRT